MGSVIGHCDRAMSYAGKVISGEINICNLVKLSCQRHFDDLKKQDTPGFPFHFSPDAGNKVCKFIEMLPHIKGDWAKRKELISLTDWQCFFISSIFGWKRGDGSRRFREAYLEIPRKNGKSSMGSGIGLYLFSADEEHGAEVYSGSTTEKQSWEVFGPARLMAQKADGYADHYEVTINARSLAIVGTACRFEPLIGKPGDGASPHGAIIDEFHEHETPDLYDTMITGMGARKQPLLLIITTAGTNLSSPCYDKRDQVVKVLQKTFVNEELFGLIYTIDDKDDWTLYENWIKANPNYGVSVYEDYLMSRHAESIQRASRQNILRCKHLNQWVNVGQAFFNIFDWDLCKDESLKESRFKGMPCWIGIDLASKIDVAAKVKVFKEGDEFYIFGDYYLPEDAAQGQNRVHYTTWNKQGFIKFTDGARIDIDMIEEDLEADAKMFDVREVPHDPWGAPQFIQHMLVKKLPMVEIPQTVGFMSEPMKELDALIRSKKIHHNGDPVLRWMISNTMGKYDKKDNVYPYKDKEENKIDGVVALIMAIGRAMVSKKKVSKYETEELVVL